MSHFVSGAVRSVARCACGSLCAILALALWTTFANAQSATKAIKDFGLLGTWADDCGKNPSPANQYAIFSVTSRGLIQLQNDFGPDYDDMVYRIVDAKRIGALRISLRQLLTSDDQIALDTVMLKAKDRIRVWSSRGADGSTFVRDGAMPSAGDRETGWMARCDVRWAGHRGTASIRRDRNPVVGKSAFVDAAQNERAPNERAP
jgi:hypothetical protein